MKPFISFRKLLDGFGVVPIGAAALLDHVHDYSRREGPYVLTREGSYFPAPFPRTRVIRTTGLSTISAKAWKMLHEREVCASVLK